jgi:methionyl-tRNA formyltransferase
MQQEQSHSLEEKHKLFKIANENHKDKEILEKLAKSEMLIIRGAIACNKNTPTKTIKKLPKAKLNHERSVSSKSGINVSNNLTICVAGKNNIAVNSLNLLVKKYSQFNICFLPNSKDNGLDDFQPSLKRIATELKIKQTTIEELYEIEELLFLSLQYSKLINTKKFKSKRLFNIHFSLLPEYRGMYTSILPIMDGKEYSGVTLHKIDDGIDTGEIIEQIRFNIQPDETARDLYFKYLENGFVLLKNNLDSLINDNYSTTSQSTSHSTYFSKKTIDFSNFSINFLKTAFEIKNQFRAFTFREYQMPTFEGWEIYKTEILNQHSKINPGTKKFENEDFIIVSTADYDIKLFKDYYKLFWGYCENGDYKNLSLIINKIPNINLQNKKNWNAIIIATYNGQLTIVKKLIEFGADINSTNKNGTTLLMYALNYYQRTQDSGIFKFLLESGSNSSYKDKNGKNLKDYIIQFKCEQLLKYLD